ncbi:hypothetical protein LZZ85_26830 [Terrimonas sp. NA20]|uniref:Globin n=1 Tax=Terrimonas ginsenosidimutans TaxID=2908004 RepID=A0ABS9L011_9BACT|nr:hypothetical protein [Terrimonas ginsenosidimutans]MCG2617946.1 hypothetical protein [Terrimonas ginsenosidimutans]
MTTSALAIVNPRYFLNRLALEHSADCLSLEPKQVIQQLFAKTPLPVMQEMFEEFCEAAVAPACYWPGRNPEVLLKFSEEMEKLIESCYLLYRDKRRRQDADHPAEIKQFFTVYSLADWKRILRDWVRAALSVNSVAETGNPKEMIPFVNGMEKLMKSMGEFARY